MPSVPSVRQGSVERKSLRIFGFEISRAKNLPVTDLSPLIGTGGRQGWFNIIREPFTGAWQRNLEVRPETVLAYNAVYACVTLIASDISKMRLRLVEQDGRGIWNEVDVPAFSPVLRKPNRYQNRIKFIEQWLISKLTNGNTYVLKERDERGVVVAQYILDPNRTCPLVTPDGAVYYRLNKDNLAGIEDNSIVVPASEIIHDTMTPLFHPLCGVSPLMSCGLAAMQGLSIQRNATNFFENGAMPSGVLTAPGTIEDETANRLKRDWIEKFSGNNVGRVAILGDGLKYEKMSMSASESQMIEQLKWTAETVCSCFHTPAYMVGLGPYPSNDNVDASNQRYYSQCLQKHIEEIELSMDEGLELAKVRGHKYGTEFDLDDLLRMDTASQYKTIGDGIGSALLTPNEGRKKIGQQPLEGGDTAYMQEQNYALSDLAKRSKLDNPFGAKPTAVDKPKPAAIPPQPSPAPPAKDFASEDYDRAAECQVAAWALKDALEGQLKQMAA